MVPLAAFGLPIAVALPLALADALQPSAWDALAADPRVPGALLLSLRSAVVATALSLGLTLWLTTRLHGSRAWPGVARALAPLLAVPHAAFAIGLAWLVAPAGALARELAPLAGWTDPPDWGTVHDAGAWGLTAVLVFKELPFLLWQAVALLARPEVDADLRRQQALARSFGLAPSAWWWQLGWPQWLPRLAWPLLAVAAYALTVVDLALIVGPTAPPPLAVLAYADLIDADRAHNARGAAAALTLALVLAAGVALVGFAAPVCGRLWRRVATAGWRPAPAGPSPRRIAVATSGGVALIYALVIATLVLLSIAGVWTFPDALPQRWTMAAWATVAASAGTLGFTVALAAGASLLALALTVGWLEATPAAWDRWALPAVLAPLVVPSLLLMSGLYAAALALAIDGTRTGVLWAHVLVVLPYTMLTLRPAWRGFDPRFAQTALTLGRGRIVFWCRVKAPLLAAPLAAAAAVGFAVSVAQFLATQFLGTGRHPTLTTEAVTLASGGQRSLAAAFALLQALLPMAAFALAATVARRRGAAPVAPASAIAPVGVVWR
ncbi:MAG: ABC transporter permease [Rubrivivax sp.]